MDKKVKLAVEGIGKFYLHPDGSRIEVLRDITLTVRENEFVSVIGPSGCGKSTLLDIIAGLTGADRGDCRLDGRSILGRRGFVSYMPQDDCLFPWRTVLDNVILPLQIQGMKKKIARKKAVSLLSHFGLEQFAGCYPHMLSGGMRQRAALLRTYLSGKDVLLLDEPFAKLDALTKLNLHQWLLNIWQRDQRSILLVTHDIDEAVLLSDRIYVFSVRPGRIAAEIEVPLPRPRDPQIAAEPAFLRIKKELLSCLEKDIFGEIS